MGDEYNNDRNKLMDFVDIEIKYFNERISRYESIYFDIFYDKLKEWKKEELFHFANELKEKIASKACKSAIKANDKLLRLEISQILSDLDSCENKYSCPHGRPITIELSKYELEKMFKRIV